TPNCLDPDDDNDGVADGADCAPLARSVQGLPADLGNTVRVEGAGLVRWSRTQQARGYDVYRLTIPLGAWQWSFSCLVQGSFGDSATDGTLPTAGQAYAYLVRGRNVCGEGPIGSTTAGQPRPVSGCAASSADTDLDGVTDLADNCPLAPNPLQQDV